MALEDLPQEVQEYLRSTTAHTEAADRVGAFYKRLLSCTRSVDATVQLTSTWIMVAFGFPKNMPTPPREKIEGPEDVE